MLTMCWAHALILVSISDMGAILMYAFYRWGERRPRELKYFTHFHTEGKWQGWGFELV